MNMSEEIINTLKNEHMLYNFYFKKIILKIIKKILKIELMV